MPALEIDAKHQLHRLLLRHGVVDRPRVPRIDLPLQREFGTYHKFALGENVKQASRVVQPGQTQRYPATRMGANAIIRREFARARNYMEQWDRYRKAAAIKNPPGSLVPPRKDLRLEVLAEVLRGERVAQ